MPRYLLEVDMSILLREGKESSRRSESKKMIFDAEDDDHAKKEALVLIDMESEQKSIASAAIELSELRSVSW